MSFVEGPVLVLASEEVLRRAITDMLRDAGAECVVACDMTQALHFFVRDPHIQHVVVDCVSPDLELQWLLGEFQELRPSVKILLSCDEDLDSQDLRLDCELTGHLPKFWEVDRLIAAIRS